MCSHCLLEQALLLIASCNSQASGWIPGYITSNASSPLLRLLLHQSALALVLVLGMGV